MGGLETIAEYPKPTRPVLRWHGGKWRLAPWILEHMPRHHAYTEAFGGAASVLLRKPRSPIEVYNDLDDDVVGLFRVLRDPDQGARLIELLSLTPFARAEFEASLTPTSDPLERARRVVIRSFQGFGSNACAATARGESTTGFRAKSRQTNKQPAHDWASHPPSLRAVIDRFSGVVIERRDALQTLADHDDVSTLHYVDPPYLPETRERGSSVGRKYRRYRHELNAPGHARLLEVVQKLSGMVMLSGYDSGVYDHALCGWRRIETSAFADGARPRIEVLWLNPACSAALERERTRPVQQHLFDGDGVL